MTNRTINKTIIKAALEDMLRERNPELQGFLEELLAKFLTDTTSKSDKVVPLDMTEIRQKYALRREDFYPLHDLFKDTPPASELTKLLY